MAGPEILAVSKNKESTKLCGFVKSFIKHSVRDIFKILILRTTLNKYADLFIHMK